jgi:flagellar biosynthesis protein FlhF
MNLQTFTASSMLECLSQVKAAMGPHAVILHTRTYRRRAWLGIRRREFVEITAGKGIGGPDRRRTTATATAVRPAGHLIAAHPPGGAVPQAGVYLDSRSASRNLLAGRAARAAVVPETARRGDPCGDSFSDSRPGQALLAEPRVREIIGTKVAEDVQELKKLVHELVDATRRKDAPDVPEELFDYYLRLVQNQVAAELAGEIVRALRKQVRPEHLSNPQFVRDKIAEHIEKLIPTSGPIARRKSHGPHVVALVGPTGVGKTTTIAKLAANLKLREKKRVGLITLDTYRIAAVDQLRKYADILGSNLRVVGTAEDLREAIRSMSDCEYILIDTAGRSPRDSLKIGELKTLLEAASPDEVHLVLSTTANQDCVELAMDRFGEVKFDKVIFTKLDEAASVGVVLNVITRVNKSLSYVTTGQDVPDDIEVGQGKRLAQLILGGGAEG